MTKKKYPITTRAELTFFDKTVTTEAGLLRLLTDKYTECLLGRISYILRTMEPETMCVNTPGLEVIGIPVKSVSRIDDHINLNVEDPAPDDEDVMELETFSEEDIIHICNYLERRFVAPSARFCPNDPMEDEDDEELLPEDITDMVDNICAAATHGTAEDVSTEILVAAASIIAFSEDKESALNTFRDAVKALPEIEQREDNFDIADAFSSYLNKNKMMS